MTGKLPRIRALRAAIALMLPLAAACAPVAPPETRAVSAPLDHLPALSGDYFRIASRAVGRPYHIYVRLPDSHGSEPQRLYPVVYLLDGDSTFPLLATQHLFLGIDEALPEAIVVGIAYGSFDPSVNLRHVDFTAPAAGLAPEAAGAAAFHAFLETELLPRIEGRYLADPTRRILVGQSAGGRFVLYSAFTRPDLFWGRIASNPGFDPNRALFFGEPAAAARSDLGLVVTSGSRDRPPLREAALSWFAHREGRANAPWTLKTHTIPDGTHAADLPNAYRVGMLWLFREHEAATRGSGG